MLPDAPKTVSGAAVSGFAKLFASLTTPKTPERNARDDSWIDDALAQDVATISYEQALRTHARYHRPNSPLPSPAEVDPASSDPQTTPAAEPDPKRSSPLVAAHRKQASVTIRLSRTEADQLRERAAAAGLTVSAYLRSCVFEVEALRAQVKDALLEMQSGREREEVPVKPSPKDWRTRLFSHWSHNRNQADA